jgi:hypothetical protein
MSQIESNPAKAASAQVNPTPVLRWDVFVTPGIPIVTPALFMFSRKKGSTERLKLMVPTWFQRGPLNRRFFGIGGADSTVLRFDNSRTLYH